MSKRKAEMQRSTSSQKKQQTPRALGGNEFGLFKAQTRKPVGLQQNESVGQEAKLERKEGGSRSIHTSSQKII